MQRINRTDPDENTASRRLLIAVTLSLLVHGMVLCAAPVRDSDSNAPNVVTRVVLPRSFTLSAFPGTDASAFDVAMKSSLREDRSGEASSLDTPDPRYYPAEQLDVLPAPRGPIRLPQDTAELGRVQLLTRIDASGRIGSVSVFDSDRTEEQNIAAMQALRDTPFNAARKDGLPVRSEVVIELAAGAGGN